MSRQDACVPPAPQCGPKSAPILNPMSVRGWQCDRQQDCPPGTAASVSPVQGWECEPLGQSLDCPKGTKFAGMGGGYCAPVDERTCRSLSGWQWEPYGGCRLGYLGSDADSVTASAIGSRPITLRVTELRLRRVDSKSRGPERRKSNPCTVTAMREGASAILKLGFLFGCSPNPGSSVCTNWPAPRSCLLRYPLGKQGRRGVR